MPMLSEYELAMLYSASGDDTKIEKIDADATAKLAGMNLIAPDSGAVGAGYVITDAGKAFIAANANSRGVV
jgi:hypothetical protein